MSNINDNNLPVTYFQYRKDWLQIALVL